MRSLFDTKSTWLIDELRTATATVKEGDLPTVVRFWIDRAAWLNHDKITAKILEAVQRNEFRTHRFPLPPKRIEGSFPIEFYADVIGDAKGALLPQLDEHAELLAELGFSVAPDKSAMTLTNPVTVTPHGRELVGGEFIHTYTYSLVCSALVKSLSKYLKSSTKYRPRIRIELRRRVDAPSCFVKSGTKIFLKIFSPRLRFRSRRRFLRGDFSEKSPLRRFAPLETAERARIIGRNDETFVDFYRRFVNIY